MPFTPFHSGPHACVALPLARHIDLPIFMAANIAIDIEPLLVLTYDLSYPLHGYCHTFLGGSAVGILLGILAFPFQKSICNAMVFVRLPYATNFLKIMVSGLLGAWLHILFDMPLYQDIRPFYPLKSNPLYGLISSDTMYLMCALLCIPAFLIYLYMAWITPRKR